MFSKGHSYSEIITELNKRGYKTNKGNNFKKTTLHDLLANERYIGTYVFSREDYDMENRKRNSHKFKNRNDMIIVENGNPAIIDKKTWDLVKERQSSVSYTHLIIMTFYYTFLKTCIAPLNKTFKIFFIKNHFPIIPTIFFKITLIC